MCILFRFRLKLHTLPVHSTSVGAPAARKAALDGRVEKRIQVSAAHARRGERATRAAEEKGPGREAREEGRRE